MAELKITLIQSKEHYDVEYECGCYRYALNGEFIRKCSPEHRHKYTKDCLCIKCGCWDARQGPQWCDNHLKFHKEAKIRDGLYFAKNSVRQLEKQLEKLLNT